MSDREIRMKCLELAMQFQGLTPEEVFKIAVKYWEFCLNTK